MTKKNQSQVGIPVVLKMELDYHLMTLHDAMKANDTEAITEQKAILEDLRKGLYTK